MITLVLIILFGLFAYFFQKQIRKNQVVIYLVALLISIAAFILFDFPLLTPITHGFTGLALFYLVMMAGALPNKTKLKKSLMSVRKEYSIIGFIVATPHALHYTIEYLNGEIAIPLFGIIAYLIMIPLFVTSFHVFRRKMSFRAWKLVQRLAYLVYGLLLIHLILNYSLKINFVLYIVLFTVYFILKFKKTLSESFGKK
ncbi:MAG: ferric reductase-like transmembrane domain-containing protein [Bacilli bacterium]|nr:ferric reductase-like transmembrane domain-containing protein [Bacilli bacterium]